ncbi:MAG: hypothetical protein MAG431_00721 [Chloroflexi bacterium]|nr:hypothetical protein [Chloroflexota bacterium]
MINPDDVKTPQENEQDGKRAYQAGEFEQAARAFAGAAEGFQVAGDTLKAAEMRNNQSVAFLQADLPEEAKRVVEGTAQIFAQADDPKRQALALGNLAAAMEGMGELRTALVTYTQSAEILQEIGAQEEYAHVMKSISALKLRLKNPLGALASMDEGMEAIGSPNWKQRLVKRLLKIPFNF